MKNPIRNYKPFKPGQSGNPNGRPKNPPEIKELLIEALADEKKGIPVAKRIIDKVIAKALRGDLKAVEMLWDRRWGKPKQSMEIEANLQTLNVEVSPEQRLQIIQSFRNEF